MFRVFIRAVSLLLIPCFLVDPASAAAWSEGLAVPTPITHRVPNTALFTFQALSIYSVFERLPRKFPPIRQVMAQIAYHVPQVRPSFGRGIAPFLIGGGLLAIFLHTNPAEFLPLAAALISGIGLKKHIPTMRGWPKIAAEVLLVILAVGVIALVPAHPAGYGLAVMAFKPSPPEAAFGWGQDSPGKPYFFILDELGIRHKLPMRTDTAKYQTTHNDIAYTLHRHSIRLRNGQHTLMGSVKPDGSWAWYETNAQGEMRGVSDQLPEWAHIEQSASHTVIRDASGVVLFTGERQNEFWSWTPSDMTGFKVTKTLGDNIPVVRPVIDGTTGEVIPNALELEMYGKKDIITLDDEMVNYMMELVDKVSRPKAELTNTALPGDKGTGKNTLIYLIAGAIEQPVQTLSFHQTISEADLRARTVMGLNRPLTTEELPGTYYQAGQLGFWLVVDEVNKAERESVLTTVNTVNQSRKDGDVIFDSHARFFFLWNEGAIYKGHLLDKIPDFFDRVGAVFMGYPDQKKMEKRLWNSVFGRVRFKDDPTRRRFEGLVRNLTKIGAEINTYAKSKEGVDNRTPPLDYRQMQRMLIHFRIFPEQIYYFREIFELDYPLELMSPTAREAFEERFKEAIHKTPLKDPKYAKRFTDFDPGAPTPDGDKVWFGNEEVGRFWLPLGKLTDAQIEIKSFTSTPENNRNLWLLAMDIHLGFHFAVLGESGTGKTQMVKYLFGGLLHQNLLVPKQITSETRSSSIIGPHRTVDGRSVFPATPLHTAMQTPRPIFYDEAPKAEPDVLAAFQGPLASGFLTTTSGDVVAMAQPQPGELPCLIIFGGNLASGGYGLQDFSAELVSRMRFHFIKPLSNASLEKVLRDKETEMADVVKSEGEKWNPLSNEDISDLAEMAMALRKAHNEGNLPNNPPSLRPFERLIADLGRYEVTALNIESKSNLLKELVIRKEVYREVIRDIQQPLRRLRVRHAAHHYSQVQAMPAGFDSALAATLVAFLKKEGSLLLSNKDIADWIKEIKEGREKGTLKKKEDLLALFRHRLPSKGSSTECILDETTLLNAIDQSQLFEKLPPLPLEFQVTILQAVERALKGAMPIDRIKAEAIALLEKLDLSTPPPAPTPPTDWAHVDWQVEPVIEPVQVLVNRKLYPLEDGSPIPGVPDTLFKSIDALEIHPNGQWALLKTDLGDNPGNTNEDVGRVLIFKRDPQTGVLSEGQSLPNIWTEHTPRFSPEGTRVLILQVVNPKSSASPSNLQIGEFNRDTGDVTQIEEAFVGGKKPNPGMPSWGASENEIIFPHRQTDDDGDKKTLLRVTRSFPDVGFNMDEATIFWDENDSVAGLSDMAQFGETAPICFPDGRLLLTQGGLFIVSRDAAKRKMHHVDTPIKESAGIYFPQLTDRPGVLTYEEFGDDGQTKIFTARWPALPPQQTPANETHINWNAVPVEAPVYMKADDGTLHELKNGAPIPGMAGKKFDIQGPLEVHPKGQWALLLVKLDGFNQVLRLHWDNATQSWSQPTKIGAFHASGDIRDTPRFSPEGDYVLTNTASRLSSGGEGYFLQIWEFDVQKGKPNHGRHALALDGKEQMPSARTPMWGKTHNEIYVFAPDAQTPRLVQREDTTKKFNIDNAIPFDPAVMNLNLPEVGWSANLRRHTEPGVLTVLKDAPEKKIVTLRWPGVLPAPLSPPLPMTAKPGVKMPVDWNATPHHEMVQVRTFSGTVKKLQPLRDGVVIPFPARGGGVAPTFDIRGPLEVHPSGKWALLLVRLDSNNKVLLFERDPVTGTLEECRIVNASGGFPPESTPRFSPEGDELLMVGHAVNPSSHFKYVLITTFDSKTGIVGDIEMAIEGASAGNWEFSQVSPSWGVTKNEILLLKHDQHTIVRLKRDVENKFDADHEDILLDENPKGLEDLFFFYHGSLQALPDGRIMASARVRGHDHPEFVIFSLDGTEKIVMTDERLRQEDIPGLAGTSLPAKLRLFDRQGTFTITLLDGTDQRLLTLRWPGVAATPAPARPVSFDLRQASTRALEAIQGKTIVDGQDIPGLPGQKWTHPQCYPVSEGEKLLVRDSRKFYLLPLDRATQCWGKAVEVTALNSIFSALNVGGMATTPDGMQILIVTTSGRMINAFPVTQWEDAHLENKDFDGRMVWKSVSPIPGIHPEARLTGMPSPNHDGSKLLVTVTRGSGPTALALMHVDQQTHKADRADPLFNHDDPLPGHPEMTVDLDHSFKPRLSPDGKSMLLAARTEMVESDKLPLLKLMAQRVEDFHVPATLPREVLNKPIDEIQDLSFRIRNILRDAKLETIGAVLVQTEASLFRINGLGHSRLNEIMGILAAVLESEIPKTENVLVLLHQGSDGQWVTAKIQGPLTDLEAHHIQFGTSDRELWLNSDRPTVPTRVMTFPAAEWPQELSVVEVAEDAMLMAIDALLKMPVANLPGGSDLVKQLVKLIGEKVQKETAAIHAPVNVPAKVALTPGDGHSYDLQNAVVKQILTSDGLSITHNHPIPGLIGNFISPRTIPLPDESGVLVLHGNLDHREILYLPKNTKEEYGPAIEMSWIRGALAAVLDETESQIDPESIRISESGRFLIVKTKELPYTGDYTHVLVPLPLSSAPLWEWITPRNAENLFDRFLDLKSPDVRFEIQRVLWMSADGCRVFVEANGWPVAGNNVVVLERNPTTHAVLGATPVLSVADDVPGYRGLQYVSTHRCLILDGGKKVVALAKMKNKDQKALIVLEERGGKWAVMRRLSTPADGAIGSAPGFQLVLDMTSWLTETQNDHWWVAGGNPDETFGLMAVMRVPASPFEKAVHVLQTGIAKTMMTTEGPLANGQKIPGQGDKTWAGKLYAFPLPGDLHLLVSEESTNGSLYLLTRPHAGAPWTTSEKLDWISTEVAKTIKNSVERIALRTVSLDGHRLTLGVFAPSSELMIVEMVLKPGSTDWRQGGMAHLLVAGDERLANGSNMVSSTVQLAGDKRLFALAVKPNKTDWVLVTRSKKASEPRKSIRVFNVESPLPGLPDFKCDEESGFDPTISDDGREILLLANNIPAADNVAYLVHLRLNAKGKVVQSQVLGPWTGSLGAKGSDAGLQLKSALPQHINNQGEWWLSMPNGSMVEVRQSGSTIPASSTPAIPLVTPSSAKNSAVVRTTVGTLADGQPIPGMPGQVFDIHGELSISKDGRRAMLLVRQEVETVLWFERDPVTGILGNAKPLLQEENKAPGSDKEMRILSTPRFTPEGYRIVASVGTPGHFMSWDVNAEGEIQLPPLFDHSGDIWELPVVSPTGRELFRSKDKDIVLFPRDPKDGSYDQKDEILLWHHDTVIPGMPSGAWELTGSMTVESDLTLLVVFRTFPPKAKRMHTMLARLTLSDDRTKVAKAEVVFRPNIKDVRVIWVGDIVSGKIAVTLVNAKDVSTVKMLDLTQTPAVWATTSRANQTPEIAAGIPEIPVTPANTLRQAAAAILSAAVQAGLLSLPETARQQLATMGADLSSPAQKPSTARTWFAAAPAWLAHHAGAQAFFTAFHEGWDWLAPYFAFALAPVLIAVLHGPIGALLVFALAQIVTPTIKNYFIADHEGHIDAEVVRLAGHLGQIYATAMALLLWHPFAGLALILSGWLYHATFDTPRLRAPHRIIAAA